MVKLAKKIFIKIFSCLNALAKDEIFIEKLSQTQREIANQMLRYSVIGIMNTLIYALTAIFLHRIIGLTPLTANGIALPLSFVSGFVGHSFYSYQQRHIKIKAFVKFISTQILALLASQLIVYMITDILELIYEIAIILSIAIMPPICWTLGRYWVFTGQKRKF